MYMYTLKLYLYIHTCVHICMHQWMDIPGVPVATPRPGLFSAGLFNDLAVRTPVSLRGCVADQLWLALRSLCGDWVITLKIVNSSFGG